MTCDPVAAPPPESQPSTLVTCPVAGAVYLETPFVFASRVSTIVPGLVAPNVPLVCWLNVAVYVVSPVGAATLWVWAPPSDQELKAYVEPPIVCGDGALIVFNEPIT